MKKSALLERIEKLEERLTTLDRHVDVEMDRVLDLTLQLEKWKEQCGLLRDRIEVVEQEIDNLQLPMPTTQHNEKDPDLFRQRVERVEGLMEGAFTKGRQCGGNVLSRLAAEAGQPSMTVTATREEDAPMAEMATKALKVAEGDMAEKLREFLVGAEALYLDGLTLGLHPTVAMERARMGAEAWDAKERAEHDASLADSGVFEKDAAG